LFPTKIKDLGHRVYLIDLYDMGLEGKTGIYVIREEKVTLIDTGSAPSVPYILHGLEKLDIRPDEIERIVLTHIHLDHAGAAGLLLQSFPNAKVVVHPKGLRHMVDPSRLIAGAREVYGERFDTLFNPILPIPEDRIFAMSDGDLLEIGGARVLRFLDTPGHASHHFSIHDSRSNGMFTGDTIGMYYPAFEAGEAPFYLPVTTPSQFDPAAMLTSLEKIRAVAPSAIFFGHFGRSEQPSEAYEQLRRWLPVYVKAGERAYAQGIGEAELADRLFREIEERCAAEKITLNARTWSVIRMDLPASAMGLLLYWKQRSKT
jgi:glyoxylase-like metal-dependent hydrolase (beta-lactamase superfamily II)